MIYFNSFRFVPLCTMGLDLSALWDSTSLQCLPGFLPFTKPLHKPVRGEQKIRGSAHRFAGASRRTARSLLYSPVTKSWPRWFETALLDSGLRTGKVADAG